MYIHYLGSEGNDEKIIIFGTDGFLKRLCSSEIVFMDGTFKSAPKLFMQICTLHCFVMGVMVPMVSMLSFKICSIFFYYIYFIIFFKDFIFIINI